jgi:hypothetical protein
MNIFQNPTKSIPKSDAQIVRVDMEQLDIGGRKSHLATINQASNYRSNEASLSNEPNAK